MTSTPSHLLPKKLPTEVQNVKLTKTVLHNSVRTAQRPTPLQAPFFGQPWLLCFWPWLACWLFHKDLSDV
jgi:hypothetical protein